MIDTITYCEDTTALIQEVQEKYPDKINTDENGNVTFLITKTPTVRNESKTLTLVRCSDEELEILESLTTLQVLGGYDEIFNDDVKHDLYKSVYPYDISLTYTDEAGNTVEYSRPQRIGVFA